MMTDEELLNAANELLRTLPSRETLHHETPENFAWFGRLSAVINAWSLPHTVALDTAMHNFNTLIATQRDLGYRQLMILLHQARNDLMMKTAGPTGLAIQHGMVFDYFDEIRKITEGTTQDVLFVDRYLNAEFISRYLSHVKPGVQIRLLARDMLPSFIPAVDAFVAQYKANIAVRSAPSIHDRFVFVDRAACYQSGASFKDGAKAGPTTLTQITDAFTAVLQIYEGLWNSAKVER